MRVKTVTRTGAHVFKLLVIPGPCANRKVGPSVVVEVFDAPVGAIRKGDVLIYGVVDGSKVKVGDPQQIRHLINWELADYARCNWSVHQ